MSIYSLHYCTLRDKAPDEALKVIHAYMPRTWVRCQRKYVLGRPVRVADDFVHIALLRAKHAADWPGARQVAAVAIVLIASIHEHQVAIARHLHLRQLQHVVQTCPTGLQQTSLRLALRR